MIIGRFSLPFRLLSKTVNYSLSSVSVQAHDVDTHSDNQHGHGKVQEHGHDGHAPEADHGHGHGHHMKPSRPPVEYNTVSTFPDHKKIVTYFEVGPGYMKYPGVDYNHHHHHEYDWRADPLVNKDIEIDVRGKDYPILNDFQILDTGRANPIPVEEYVTPFEGRDDWGDFAYTHDTAHLYSNTLILNPCNKKAREVMRFRRAPYWSPEADINHEYDYESEDYDYQAENFRLMHFRKQGPLFGWYVIGFLPWIYFWSEFLFQHYPDEDYWRLARPPPLNYPDTEDTDDTDTYDDYHSPSGRYLRDTGIVGPLWFDIVNGKKVYNRFAGVNTPMEDI